VIRFTLLTLALLLSLPLPAGAQGSTSQHAFERCGETHLSVTNNTTGYLDVVMFGQYERLASRDTVVFWTDQPVTAQAVTRRRDGQRYHTSVTSRFTVEQRECTSLWATL